VDGYRIVKEAHRGGMARLYEVCIAFPDEHTGTGFDQRPGEGNLLMKVPRMSPRDSSETIVSFEVESMILPMLKGKHMPTLRGKGSLQKVPYLLMEQLSGQTLLQWLLEAQRSERKATVDELVGFGIAMAVALFSLHRQRCCHHDLKPANVFLHRGGHVVLLDFGLARHAHLPDLHAEEMRQPVGSPAVLAPEQIVGIRGDIRSDIYALGVLLYVMATLRFPFGMPTGRAALKSRIWSSPCPIRKLRPDLPSWFQEIVFRCLLPLAADRYQSAAHLVFDLRHPTNIKIGALGGCIDSPPWRSTIQRLFRYLREGYQPSEHRGERCATSAHCSFGNQPRGRFRAGSSATWCRRKTCHGWTGRCSVGVGDRGASRCLQPKRGSSQSNRSSAAAPQHAAPSCLSTRRRFTVYLLPRP